MVLDSLKYKVDQINQIPSGVSYEEMSKYMKLRRDILSNKDLDSFTDDELEQLVYPPTHFQKNEETGEFDQVRDGAIGLQALKYYDKNVK